MCETTNRDLLRNGHASDPQTQGHALADIIDSLAATDKRLTKIEEQLSEIPKRDEVRDMTHDALRIHVETCDAARDDRGRPEDKNKFRLAVGKLLGFEAEGRAGVIITAVFWMVVGFVVYYAIPRVSEWIGTLSNK